jgi:hypothetical protein
MLVRFTAVRELSVSAVVDVDEPDGSSFIERSDTVPLADVVVTVPETIVPGKAVVAAVASYTQVEL